MIKKIILFTTLVFFMAGNYTLLFPKDSINKDNNDKEKLERMRLVLNYAPSKQVKKALSYLSKLEVETQRLFIPELRNILDSGDVLSQRKLLGLIGNFKFNDLDHEVIPFLQSKANEVFFVSLRTVEKKKIRKALPVLRGLIEESDYTQLGARLPDILSVLGKLRDRKKATFLLQKLKSEETIADYKKSIISYLAAINYQEKNFVEFLHELLSNEEEDVRLRSIAAYSIGKMKLRGARRIINKEFKKIEEISDPDKKNALKSLRINLIYALVQLKDETAENILFNMARDDDEFMRLKALHYIKDIRSARFKALLNYQSQYDSSLKVQKKAKEILENFE